MRALLRFRFLVVIFLTAQLLSCSTTPPSSTPGGTPEGPGASTPGTEPTPTPGGARGPLRAGLVLGGAGVASFATVGILKRLQQEGVKIDFIVATGWPALFAVGGAMLKSVHDLEWFAMRLKAADLFDTGFFDFSKDFSSQDRLAKTLEKAFPARDLRQGTLPVILTASPVDRAGVDTYASGPWLAPLMKAMAVPGVYRPYPAGTRFAWTASSRGLDVAEAQKRGETVIIAVDMYEDYLRFLTQRKLDDSAALFRGVYASALRSNVEAALGAAPIKARIQLNGAPGEWDRRREAILAGYREGSRLVGELRRQVGE